MPTCPWPPPNIVAEVKAEGFDLLSKECVSLQVFSIILSLNQIFAQFNQYSQQGKQSSMEGDAWVLSFLEAENRLLQVFRINQTLLSQYKL